MGCSDSSTVIQKPVQPKMPTIKPKPQQADHFLFGHIAENQFLFAKINLAQKSIDRLSIPQDFEPHNYSSMLSIENKQFFITGGINFDLTNITSNCCIYDSASHTIKKMANMNQPRYTHAALYLQNECYVFGGRYFGNDEVAILNSCEIYSFKKNQWTVLPDLNIKRCTCYGMAWGRQVYVFGGYTGIFERSQKIEKLNLKGNRWQILEFQLNRGIQSTFIISQNSNEITIFGGNTNAGPTSSVSTINFEQTTIQSHKNLSQYKMLHKSFKEGEEVYIFGGSQNGNIEVYNTLNKRTQVFNVHLNEMFRPDVFEVLSHSQNSLIVNYQKNKQHQQKYNEGDDIILTFGTTQQPFIFELNVSIPSSRIWPAPLALKLHSEAGGVCIGQYKYLLFGGIEDDSLSSVTADTYLYDHKTRSCAKLNPMITPRYVFAFQKIKERVYAVGGANCDNDGNLIILNQCQYFDINQKTWNNTCKLPILLMSSMSLNYNNQLYVFGGMTSKKKRNNSIFKFNQKLDIWSELKFHLPYGLEAASIYKNKNNQFYIFGGRVETGDTNVISHLIFTNNQDCQCAFFQKSTLSQNKCGVKIFRPSKQDFIVCLGGQIDLVSYYDVQSLKLMEWDGLKRLKEVFLSQLQSLNHPKMKNYLTISGSQLTQ